MKVVWSPLAEHRAMEAVDYIAEDRPAAAARWLEGLLDHVAQLDQLAERGRMVPEIGRSAYREVLFAPYRVIYRVDAGRVVILTLRHTRRAWDSSEIDARV
jgi:plasmid stabilization system protein ParE